MKTPTHSRRGKQIIDLETGVVEDFKYVNEAKRRSRALKAEGSIVRRLTRKFSERSKASAHRMSFAARWPS